MPSLQRFCDAMRWAADSDQVGYSQSDRWDVEFFGGGSYNADCSSLVIQALRYAGFDTGGATYTGNMSGELCARGWERLSPDADLLPGDILLNDGNHVAAWLGDCLAQASIDENGNIAGGARGDQTGWEVNTRGWYSYPWDCVLRHTGPEDGDEPEKKVDELLYIHNYGGDCHRLYNPNNGAHHFTLSAEERDKLVKDGWKYEGVAFKTRRGGSDAMYRMYNPYSGDHLFTPRFDEAHGLQDAGWVYEGVPFFAWGPGDGGVKVTRLYNPYDGMHHMTASDDEVKRLVKEGWKEEESYAV